MRLLAFSDLHVDTGQAERLVDASEDADVVVGVGDFASVHSGLEETIAVLRRITKPAVLVPGNNETEDALRDACDGWENAVVLHGESTEIDGVEFFGLGAGSSRHPVGLELRPHRGGGRGEARRMPRGLRARRPLAAPGACGHEQRR